MGGVVPLLCTNAPPGVIGRGGARRTYCIKIITFTVLLRFYFCIQHVKFKCLIFPAVSPQPKTYTYVHTQQRLLHQNLVKTRCNYRRGLLTIHPKTLADLRIVVVIVVISITLSSLD